MNAVADRIHHSPLPLEIQTVAWSRPFAWLRRGAADLRMSLRVSIAHGIGMTLLGWLLFATFGTDPYFVGVAVTAFLLVGPVMSTGVCEVSRRLERGENTTFDDSIAALQREGTALLKYGTLLAASAVGWAALIMALTVIGFATMLIGMTLIIPLLGHATWRAYRDLVQPFT
jgi:uncharacterized membrane protein